MTMHSQFGLRLVLCALAVPSLAGAQGSNEQNNNPAVGISAEETLISAKKYYALQQYSEALPLFRKAAEPANAEAALYLGVMYANGQGGLAKDDAQALSWYRKAADGGNAIGMRLLGYMYADGRGGLAKDETQAVNWWRKAADAGDAPGMFNLGVNYEYGLKGLAKDAAQAVSWYRKAADAGHAAGMKFLGDMYANGQGGLAKDDAQAVSWFRKAADAGDAAGMGSLGGMYANGRGGLAKDDAQAVSWWRKAADAGDAAGMVNLGVMYASGGGGLAKDDAQAVSWWRKAADAGNAAGMSRLGVMYGNGRGGLPKDEAQAVSWFRKAADAGDAAGMSSLGFMYANGRGGLPKDDAQAVSWYRKAAGGGDAAGMGLLGVMYLKGEGGLAKDDAQAVTWFRKAADGGDAAGMTFLGAIYEDGRGGLAKDHAQAVNWYRKAADAGDARALEMLKRSAQSPAAPVVPSLASAQGSNAPLAQTREEVLGYAEKVVGDAETPEKAAPSTANDFEAIQRHLQQLQGDLKECDRLLAGYIEKNPGDAAALFLQVRLDRVKFGVFPIQMSGGKVTQDVPAPERDPQQTLDRILALGSNNAEAYYWKARLYGISRNQGTGGKLSSVAADLPKAIEFGRKAVSSAPQNIAYREALAIFLMGGGSLTEATDVLKLVQNGRHPMYRLLLDRSKIPIPEGSVSHADATQIAVRLQGERGQDYPGLRVAAYVVPEPASKVEAFYSQHWNGFKLYEMGAQEDPKVRGAYLRWDGAEPQVVKEKPPDGYPSNAVLIVVIEIRNPTEDVRKRLPVPVGDVYSVIEFINTRDLGKP